jgi:hypothetical protein
VTRSPNQRSQTDQVFVFVEEAGAVVAHVSGVVFDDEIGVVFRHFLKVLVLFEVAAQFIQKRAATCNMQQDTELGATPQRQQRGTGQGSAPVTCVSAQQTLFVEKGEHANRFFLDQLTHNGVIEVGDGLPRDAFALVLVLLGFDGFVDEHLLQLLIDEIDAKLLETVTLKNLETDTHQHHTTQRQTKSKDKYVDTQHR